MDFTFSLWDLALLSSILLYALYVYGTWTFGRFKGTKVPHLKPKPLVGNTGKFLLGRENIVENIGKGYTSFPNDRFAGVFQMRSPTILIRDPELIRQIGVKDFEYFLNHRSFANETVDPLFGNNLFSLKGQKWRDMRATLSPAFTGSKMRSMYTLVSDCAQQMAEYLKKETGQKGLLVLELKDLFTRYANDVIATTAFGVKVDSLKDRENLFYRMGKQVNDFSGFWVSLKFFCFQLMPSVMKLLRFKFIDEACGNFFRKLVHDTMAMREREGIIRPDMIHLLMQARKGQLQHEKSENSQEQDAGFATVTESEVGKSQIQKQVWTDDDLTAQALIFFLAGFDTTSTALCFTAYELTVNPDVQKRLQEEIDEVCQEFGDKTPDYEGINKMKYLDMVISEGLRMWPPVPATDRVCIKPYVIEDYEGNKFEIQKDEVVFFPAYHLQRDEKYYENPEKFNPERFNDDNKKDINPFTYFPFGVGPRNCIGSRFALMEAKAILFNILRHFDMVPCEKTQIPLKLSSASLQMEAEKGFWTAFKPRNSQ